VPGGALSPQGSQWLFPRSHTWRVPVRVRSKRFRGQFKEALTNAGLREQVPSHVWQQEWVTPCEPAGTGTAVITYLAPYSRRLAMTNTRIEKLEDGQVTFRLTERGSPAWTHLTLPAAAFSRRFRPHVLPKGLMKVRYDGVLSPHGRPALAQIKRLLERSPRNDPTAKSGQHRARQETHPAPEQERHCRTCGGPLVLWCRLAPHTRGPPP
jgi:hypothetical protein